jgi:hypothetical protein
VTTSNLPSSLLRPYETQILEVAEQIESIERELFLIEASEEGAADSNNQFSVLERLEAKAEQLRALQKRQGELMREIKSRGEVSKLIR